jgi:hypothetical protein
MSLSNAQMAWQSTRKQVRRFSSNAGNFNAFEQSFFTL